MKNIIKKYVEAQKRLNSKQNWIDSLYCTAINMAICTVAVCCCVHDCRSKYDREKGQREEV